MAELRTTEIKTDQEDVPEWVKFALNASKEIEKTGVALPPDLAEHHDYYARSKPKS